MGLRVSQSTHSLNMEDTQYGAYVHECSQQQWGIPQGSESEALMDNSCHFKCDNHRALQHSNLESQTDVQLKQLPAILPSLAFRVPACVLGQSPWYGQRRAKDQATTLVNSIEFTYWININTSQTLLKKKKTEKEKLPPNLFSNARITPIPKLDKDTIRKPQTNIWYLLPQKDNKDDFFKENQVHLTRTFEKMACVGYIVLEVEILDCKSHGFSERNHGFKNQQDWRAQSMTSAS